MRELEDSDERRLSFVEGDDPDLERLMDADVEEKLVFVECCWPSGKEAG